MKCEICGSPERLNCHEHWEFDEANAVQRLVRLGTVCNMCHHVSHIGRSKQLSADGHLDIQAVRDHFLKVNAVDAKTLAKHEKEAEALFLKRSQTDWKIDFGPYATLLPKDAG